MSKCISIKKAEYLGGYKILFKFNDNTRRVLDFEGFISSSMHPDVKKYKNQELFRKFNLEHGEIEWNDYELAFPIYDLYRGRL